MTDKDCCDENKQNICPDCNSSDIKEELKQESIISGDDGTTITIPVMVCQKCKSMWTDYRAEDIETEALNKLKRRQ